jgi:hypothetical protein
MNLVGLILKFQAQKQGKYSKWGSHFQVRGAEFMPVVWGESPALFLVFAFSNCVMIKLKRRNMLCRWARWSVPHFIWRYR